MGERCYVDLESRDGELVHEYGDHVHLISDPLALTWLSRLCHPSCVQPEVNRIVSLLYRGLVREVINREFPRRVVRTETRMSSLEAGGYYEGTIIDPDVEVTTVDIARAGILPSMVCFEALSEILDPGRVRQDHILMNRTTDADEHVTGAATHGRKIAGPIEDRYLLFPDPMGATGGSLTEAISYYREQLDGRPRHCFALNLIVTPEFIRKLSDSFPNDVSIYAYRLDRGMSSEAALNSRPGTYPDQEFGLNDVQYIVPGAGGMGEVMNNALS